MADQLATPEDLASLLQRDDLDLSTATLLVEIATAVVQAEVRQRLTQVTETITLLGTVESWLDLPQRPVTAVAAVELDGEAVTDWTRFGSRLWRRCGWAASNCAPSTVEVTCTHGYSDGAQELQLARGATLSVIRDWYDNPSATISHKIDDYAATYSAMAARLEASPGLRSALRRQYGQRTALVRLG